MVAKQHHTATKQHLFLDPWQVQMQQITAFYYSQFANGGERDDSTVSAFLKNVQGHPQNTCTCIQGKL